MKKYAITSIVSITLCFALCFGVCAIGIQSEDLVFTTADKSKISDELLSVIKSSDSNSLIPVDIWFYETETEDIESKVKASIGINKEVISNDYARNIISEEKIDEYITTERKLYSETQTKLHNEFLERKNWLSSEKSNALNPKVSFISKYAPVINANLTPEEIIELTADSTVQSISYSPVLELTSDCDVSIPAIRADYTRNTLGYNGSGIKIGIMEAKGLPSLQTGLFINSNVILDTTVPNVTSDHATLVAAIIGGRSATESGIVPNSQLYATYQVAGTDTRDRIEWLLSQGVNVINMSAGVDVSTAVYADFERWFDHIAINHSVHFVKSAGNNGANEYNGRISRPGLAYNIITVGNIDDGGTLNYNDDVLRYTSSTIVDNGPAKPDISAPGTNISFGTLSDTGTSFSAPHVTGVVAQLCQAKPALKTLQDSMKAILTASIYHPNLSFDVYDSGYQSYGAGMVDAHASYFTAYYSNYVSSSFSANTAAVASRSHSFYVSTANTKVRVSLTWLKYSILSGTHSTATPTDYAIADLDLSVFDPNGNSMGLSCTSDRNVEIVEFDSTIAGTYQIRVTLYGTSPKTIYYGVAWW